MIAKVYKLKHKYGNNFDKCVYFRHINTLIDYINENKLVDKVVTKSMIFYWINQRCVHDNIISVSSYDIYDFIQKDYQTQYGDKFSNFCSKKIQKQYFMLFDEMYSH